MVEYINDKDKTKNLTPTISIKDRENTGKGIEGMPNLTGIISPHPPAPSPQERGSESAGEWVNPYKQRLEGAEKAYYDYKPQSREDIMNSFDADKHAYLTNYLKELYKPPQARLTPEQEQRARMMSGISDGLSSLAEMFAHGRGAYIRDREPNVSQKTTNERLEQWRQKYENDLFRYNNAMAGARERDINNYIAGRHKDDAFDFEKLKYNYSNNYNLYRDAEGAHNAEEKAAQAQAFSLEKQKRQFEAQRKLKDIDTNTKIYIAKIRASTGGNKNPKTIPIPYNNNTQCIYIPENEVSKGVFFDAAYNVLAANGGGVLGNPVKEGGFISYYMKPTKQQMESYVRENLNKLPDDFITSMGANIYGAYNPKLRSNATRTTAAPAKNNTNKTSNTNWIWSDFE